MKSNHNYNRSNIVSILLSSIWLALISCSSAGTQSQEEAKQTAMAENTALVYVGTYAEADDESIFLYRLNTETGELTRVNAVKGGKNPSYLTLDKQRHYMYAVNEMDEAGEKKGAVSAFAVNEQDGSLTFLNKQPSVGGSLCYISLDETGRTALVASYGDGNVAAFPVQENGELQKASDKEQHTGSSINKDRQEKPHAHFIAPSPDNRYAFAVDLGIDKVLSYRLNPEKSTLTPNEPAVAYTAVPGSGPRHLTFHPNGRYAYLIHELNSTVAVLAYDAAKGTFSEVQTITTIPDSFTENNQCAAIKVSPDGKFLYGSNRGHNSIVVYAIDENTGQLTLVEHENTKGNWPRDFAIDQTGNVLLVANERSNNITSFKVDKTTGKLTATAYEAEVPKPVCLKVVPEFKGTASN